MGFPLHKPYIQLKKYLHFRYARNQDLIEGLLRDNYG